MMAHSVIEQVSFLIYLWDYVEDREPSSFLDFLREFGFNERTNYTRRKIVKYENSTSIKLKIGLKNGMKPD